MSEETYSPDNLIAGGYPLVTGEVTILSGANLTRGTVLGKVTASGKCVAVDSSAGDGSEVPVGILAADCDASAADKEHVPYYLAGEFNEDELSFGGTDTADTHRVALRGLNIYLKECVSA